MKHRLGPTWDAVVQRGHSLYRGLLALGGGSPRDPCPALLEWARAQPVAPGAVRTLPLPAALARQSGDGTADVLRTDDERLCVLRKTRVGWKDNFEGTLCCSRPLPAAEVVEGAGGRSYISIPGPPPFEELYVRRRHDPCRYDVFFDLN
jgi:hypothetical protein